MRRERFRLALGRISARRGDLAVGLPRADGGCRPWRCLRAVDVALRDVVS